MKKIAQILVPIVLLAVAGGAYWYGYARYFETTDNAYVQTDITNVSSQVDAQIIKVNFKNNQKVNKGDVLALLDDREFIIKENLAQAALDKSKAQLSNANAAYQMQTSVIEEYKSKVVSMKAKLDNSLQQYSRLQSLEKRHFVSKNDIGQGESAFHVDQADYLQAKAELRTQQDNLQVLQSEIDQANAMVKQAKANLAQAKLSLDYTRITAPISGVVSNSSLQVGMMSQSGQSVVSLVSDETPWIKANFKETQKEEMHKGQSVDVMIDAYPDKTYKAKVESIAPATASTFALLPPDNSTGNFTKVVQRVSVKIVFDEPVHLDNGLSAVVTVDTRK